MDFLYFIKNNKLIVLIVSIIFNFLFLILSIVLYVHLYNYNCPVCETNFKENEIAINEQEEIEKSFYVEVKGAVKKPGVYKMSNTNIINDLITIAGGFNKNAYSKNINLSKKLTEELVIYVYTENEYKKKDEKEIKETICECPTYDISPCTAEFVSEIIVNDNTESVIVNNNDNSNLVDDTKDSLVNINIASKEKLMELSGIGESKALDIINYRELNGKFSKIEDIKNVSGIGNAIYEKIKDHISV